MIILVYKFGDKSRNWRNEFETKNSILMSWGYIKECRWGVWIEKRRGSKSGAWNVHI